MNVRELIERYNDAWNAHDLDAIHALHAPDIVFENFTAGERVEGADAVREHIGTIFRNWPDLRFTTRRLYARDSLVVCEWTAEATHQASGKRVSWKGVDVFPFENGLIKRKDVYSAFHTIAAQVGSSEG